MMDWYFFSIVDRRTFMVGVNSPESMANSCSRKAIFLTFSKGAKILRALLDFLHHQFVYVVPVYEFRRMAEKANRWLWRKWQVRHNWGRSRRK